jgi:hypothetical protein
MDSRITALCSCYRPALASASLDEDTFIIGQSKCAEPGTPGNPGLPYEAPLLYLLVGEERALLLDTGASESPALFPIKDGASSPGRPCGGQRSSAAPFADRSYSQSPRPFGRRWAIPWNRKYRDCRSQLACGEVVFPTFAMAGRLGPVRSRTTAARCHSHPGA